MRTLFITFLFISTITSISAQEKSLPAFSKISTGGSVEVELIPSDQTKAEYTMTKGSADDLHIEVKNDVLTVKIKNKKNKWNRSDSKASVKIYYKSLDKIDAAAGSSISSESSVKSSDLIIEVSSGATCSLPIESSQVKVDASSGARLYLRGKTGSIMCDASSGANIDVLGLTADIAEADVSSGARISLNVKTSLTATASSGGSIKYKGNPEKTKIDSGMSGSIKSI